jgi:ribosomal protein S3AE
MAQAKIKQKFFDVEIPILKKETQLYAYNIDELNGRTIKYDLTRFLRGKSVLLSMDVKVEGNKASAYPKEFVILPYFIRRIFRKGTNYVEDSFYADTKDSKVEVKPFLITRKKVSRAVRKALREKAREEIRNYLKNKDTKTIFEELIQNRMQKPLSLKLKKIYPLSLCEIRVFRVEKSIESK